MKALSGLTAVLAGVVLATSGAVAVAAEESVTLTGTYRRMAKEVVTGTTTSHAYDDLLVTRTKTYKLRLRGARPVPGSTVRVSANTTTTGAYQVTGTTTVASAPSATTLGNTSTLAVLAYWTTPDSMTQATAKASLFTDANAWIRETSYGQTALTGTVTPWLKIAAPSGGRCYDYADQIMSRARAAALTAGFRWESYHRTLVYFPRCTGSDTANLTGWAFEPGDSIWLNGVMDRRTSVHEHGHSFGIGHARAYSCSTNGVRVTLGDACAISEYGDPYDAMGNSAYAGHYTGHHKDQLGWLRGTRKHVMTSPSGTFTLPPFERSSTLPVAIAANGATEARRYWFEYRQPIGADSRFPAGATGGVMIHLEDPGLLEVGSYLLDPTPSDGTMNNAVLGPGRSWTSPDGVRIAVGSVSTSGATVTITGARPEPMPPSAPRALTVQPGHGRAKLTWQEPALDGHSDRRRYVVRTNTGAMYTVGPDVTSYAVTGLQNGTPSTLSVEAHNDAGAGDPASITVTPVASTTPPVVTITSPAAGATVHGIVTVTATVKPDTMLTAPDAKRWYVDGTYVRSGSTFTWDTLPLANGPHTIRAVGYDELDRTGSAEATFTVRNVRPGATITSPATASRVTGGTVTVAVDTTPSEDGTAVQRVELYANNGFVGTAWSAPFTIPWNVTHYTGTATLRARAFDSAGRWSDSAPATVTVYHDPPRVTLTSPAQDATHRGTSVTFTADVAQSAPDVPISHVTFSGTLGTFTDYGAPYSATFDTSAFSGSAWVEVRAVDIAGRTGYASRSLPVANPLPAVTITSPASNATLRTKTLTIAGTATRSSAGTALDRVTVGSPNGTYSPRVNEDGTWSLTIDVTGRYGPHRLTASVVDASGYRASTVRDIVLERPAPAVTFVAPPDGTVSVMRPVTLTATVEPAADAVRTVTSVCFWDTYSQLGCATREPDGKTWVARDVLAYSTGARTFSVVVGESDGFSAERGRATVGVYGPPAMPHQPAIEHGGDATLSVSWESWSNGKYTLADEYVVRDENGAIVARSATSPAVFRPPVAEEQYYTVEAVNRWGRSDAAGAGAAAAYWQTSITSLRYSRTATTYPGTVTVTARLLRHDGVPVVGRRMLVSGPSPNGTWQFWVLPPTSATGFTSLTFTPAATVTLEMVHEAEEGYDYAVSDSTRITVRALVTGNLRSGRMALGGTTYFDGRVQPARQGRFVYLQRFYAGAWRTVTYRGQAADGRVSVPIKPPARGTYLYRLYYGGDSAALGNVSPSRTLYVT